ncbi:MAG TPA: hypothetical protein ENI15_03085 [Spirochaetes bacterium]|nr:hypothetical protein [Spirochaetota bacterium]
MAGIPLFQSNLIYSPGKKMNPPGTNTPRDTAVSFFMLIDSGEFEQAWEMALEPDWTPGETDVSYSDEVSPGQGDFQGWTKKEDFVKRSKKEIGKGGIKIKLNNIEARSVDFDQSDFESSVFYLKDFETVDKIEVRGHLLGACSIYKWDKELFVVKIDGKYKVLLSGAKKSKSLFYQLWFSNLKAHGNIKGIKQ